MYAAERSKVAAVKTLLDLGASLDDRDNERNDALLWWTKMSEDADDTVEECLTCLLDRGANIHTRDAAGVSPLILSIILYDSCTLEMLLLHGANPNDVSDDGSGWTALMEACRQGSVEMVKLLLDQGADRLVTDRVGCTAAHYVDRVGNRNDPKKVALRALLNTEEAAMNFVVK
jgi:ankyrin repeat protein